MNDFTQSFVTVLQKMTPVDAQNKLMGCTDREIAVAMLQMNDTDMDFIFSLIAPSKGERIRQETKLLKKNRVSDNTRKTILKRLFRKFEGNQDPHERRSYFKPRGR